MKPEMIQNLQDVAHKLRIHSIKMTDVTGTGHPTSCSSMAEIMSVLFFHAMKYNPQLPSHPSNDRLVLSKGHAAPILYAAWAEAGYLTEDQLMTLRLIDSDLEGHPTPRLPFVNVATGSLGQGLAVSIGMAYGGLLIEKSSYRVYCIMGDGECSEGSVWEAAAMAGYYKLHNLVAIVDVNGLGQSDVAPLKHDMNTYKLRFEAFGFRAKIVDGQSVEELVQAFDEAKKHTGSPFAILAKTEKGAHFPGISGVLNWHGKALGSESSRVIKHLEGLIKNKSIKGSSIISPEQTPLQDLEPENYPIVLMTEAPSYSKGQNMATRVAAGTALVKIGKSCPRIAVCDADVKNSTYTDKFKAEFPGRFVDCFIAEQNLVGTAIGLNCSDRFVVFISTFAAFLTRAHDQIRMGAISNTQIKIIGTHCGVSIGEDGTSQMALEDLAMFRSLPGAIVLYPSDAVSAERAVELAARTPSLVYIRISRPATPVIYPNDEIFTVGNAKICLQTPTDKILLVTSGVTLIECLKAAEILKKSGVNARVMDLFSIKPIDSDSLLNHAIICHGLVLTVEDHYPEGGIGEVVSSFLSSCKGHFLVHKICVTGIPRSGKPHELMEMYDLTSEKIALRALSIIGT